MKVLVTGAGGMLARSLVPHLRSRGHEVVALDRNALDVTDPVAVDTRISLEQPDAVVQCAAYTAVDRAETEEAVATRVNAVGTSHVARSCDRLGTLLVYPSTDYVFAGSASTPYGPEDPPDPVNAYGRSKLAGERVVLEAERSLVVRTGWLYGEGGPNFVDTVLRLATEQSVLRVVDDQVGRPTWAASLSENMALLMEAGAQGIFHATDGGEPVSWFGFAREIMTLRGMGTEVVPVSSSEYPRPARRPAYSVLDCSATERLTGRPAPGWPDSLRRYLASRAGSGIPCREVVSVCDATGYHRAQPRIAPEEIEGQ
ncbi:MAG TPA: dTDP-4-dehydrorhamnose reductase [Longimicrobiaceae bacterium]|nr:dTDP-4-dehydrorhamnose reductase [Longimicrobiaceae bacterium]